MTLTDLEPRLPAPAPRPTLLVPANVPRPLAAVRFRNRSTNGPRRNLWPLAFVRRAWLLTALAALVAGGAVIAEARFRSGELTLELVRPMLTVFAACVAGAYTLFVLFQVLATANARRTRTTMRWSRGPSPVVAAVLAVAPPAVLVAAVVALRDERFGAVDSLSKLFLGATAVVLLAALFGLQRWHLAAVTRSVGGATSRLKQAFVWPVLAATTVVVGSGISSATLNSVPDVSPAVIVVGGWVILFLAACAVSISVWRWHQALLDVEESINRRHSEALIGAIEIDAEELRRRTLLASLKQHQQLGVAAGS